MKRILLVFAALSILLACACEKANIRAGEASLEGTWDVVEILSSYGERMELGIGQTEDFRETGFAGTFEFSEEEVRYSYTRLDTLYVNNDTWQLERERVNAGFVRVEQYTLQLGNDSFQCAFGDETKNAERDATEVLLIMETQEVGPYQRVELKLEKQ